MLFKSDFKPTEHDKDLDKTLLMLRLNNEYQDALMKYKIVKEKEEEQRLR
jgi:hypothetical protein